MHYRQLGRTGFSISEISFGAWAIGGSWGSVQDNASLDALRRAVDLGVNFIDTADVYGDGRSERLIAQLKKERREDLIVATKAGRRLDPHVTEGYNYENLRSFVERSLKNLEMEALDLVQLHCPPTDVFYRPEVFEAMDQLVQEGKIRHYGVSVEKVEEALKAMEYPGVETVQIIFNMFRHRPKELFFQEAARRNVGIIVRVPLASGLLTGKFSKDTKFEPEDHRQFNRHGEAFDKGETFAGVDYDRGLEAVEHLRSLVPEGWTLPQMALRWILMHDEVSCTIPGAKRAEQAEENIRSGDMPALSSDVMRKVDEIYQTWIAKDVHHRW